ncbi:hypothetical protein HID58_005812, partial [Brassica napus]
MITVNYNLLDWLCVIALNKDMDRYDLRYLNIFLPWLRNRCLLQQCCSLTAEAFRALR